MEEAATLILKEQIRSIEEWIEEQQLKHSQEKQKIEQAVEENRKSLLGTGSFSDDEVRDHLAAIQKKADQKQATYDDYAQLLARCHNIYA